MKSIKVLIVEDEVIIARDLAYHLKEMGLIVSGILMEGEEVEEFVRKEMPDIVLMDISLRGEMDGISAARLLKQKYDIPIIYLTANADDRTFEQAKSTKPFAFIEKPFKKRTLFRTIELLIEHLMEDSNNDGDHESPSFILNDRIFVKSGNSMVKIYLKDILYIQAERAYSQIATRERKYLLSSPLKAFEDQVSADNFLRVHRSFIVNLEHIDGLEENSIIINKERIPVSRSFQETLFKSLNIL